MLDGFFATIYAGAIPFPAFLAASLISLALGGMIALCYRWVTGSSATLGGALALLPFLVQVVILLVNGNLGAGVAVAGAFSLVRFRSAPGTAQDITVIFLAMTVGLACGMGYVALGAFAAVVVCGMLLAMHGAAGAGAQSRELKITIPENLDYAGLFDDLFDRYTRSADLEEVKTTNLGSLYCLRYRVRLKQAEEEKAFLDQLRCRNGNLDIVCAHAPVGKEAL